ncbi:MAG: phosphoribosyl-ATP diphosphatase [Rubritepida sp.]|nr:phosphoribosyl-ATP diphosphatase [Rubritepida sp.]
MPGKPKGKKQTDLESSIKRPARGTKSAREPGSKRPQTKKQRRSEPTPTTGAEILDRFWSLIETRRSVDFLPTSHSARLIARGTQRVAKKLGEEVVELIIEAIGGDRPAKISEAADVFYHLMVLLVDAGIEPKELWRELRRREGVSDVVSEALSNSEPEFRDEFPDAQVALVNLGRE